MKLAIVVGTRPEIIKMSAIIRECQTRKIPLVLIHSNQHYSPEMDSVFFKELELPVPHYNLLLEKDGGAASQTGNILVRIEPILEKEKPDFLLVQGDTNTVLGSALAAAKLQIPVGHVEAGLRSYDRGMPEEINRILTDHMSDLLFAVTDIQKDILFKEGIDHSKIKVLGNTVADALLYSVGAAEKKSEILNKLELTKGKFILVTAHRPSNVDTESSLLELISCLKRIDDEFQRTIVWPIHPRTLGRIKSFNLEMPKNVIITESLGYLDFIQLMKNSEFVITDSGGLQEESCILGVPCITLRENTERPETITVGANVLVGRDADKMISAMKDFNNSSLKWVSPFGDGTTAKKIVDVLVS